MGDKKPFIHWQPTPVLLPGKFHGWGSLVGYSPWGCKELDTTEQLCWFSLKLSQSFWNKGWGPFPSHSAPHICGGWGHTPWVMNPRSATASPPLSLLSSLCGLSAGLPETKLFAFHPSLLLPPPLLFPPRLNGVPPTRLLTPESSWRTPSHPLHMWLWELQVKIESFISLNMCENKIKFKFD